MGRAAGGGHGGGVGALVLLAGVLTVAIFGMYGEGYVEKPFIYFQF